MDRYRAESFLIVDFATTAESWFVSEAIKTWMQRETNIVCKMDAGEAWNLPLWRGIIFGPPLAGSAPTSHEALPAIRAGIAALALLEAANSLVGRGILWQAPPPPGRHTGLPRYAPYEFVVQFGDQRTAPTQAWGPHHVRLAPSWRTVSRRDMQESGRWISASDAAGLSPRVGDLLDEARRCFEAGMYLAAVVILGAASETAMFELAEVLCEVGAGRGANVSDLAKVVSDQVGLARVLTCLEDGAWNKAQQVIPNLPASTRRDEFRRWIHYADLVRITRNEVHGRSSAEPTTLEALRRAGLLLAEAGPYFRWIAAMKAVIVQQDRQAPT